jgi:2-dehydro-3-deoxygalactonokinase
METSKKRPALIAVDWGTTKLRAYLVDDGAQVLDEVSSDEGISSVREGSFATILTKRCGEWMERFPSVPVLMAGMVGSRNGWREVPYVRLPASPEDIMSAVSSIEMSGRRLAGIVPGLLYHDGGVADVIRGEETLVIGTDAKDDWIVLPGTHSKWVRVSKGQIVGFKTYMTGEFYGLLRHHSVLRLLAAEPESRAGFAKGVEAANRDGGLLHHAFEARTSVLDGTMRGEEAGPFLSGLLLAHEVKSAMASAPPIAVVKLVAEDALAQNYKEVLQRFGLKAKVLLPKTCFANGMLRLKPGWLK